MASCNIDHSDENKNNGLITKIWGNPGWTFGHAVTFGYPIEPTEEDKVKYKNYFMSLGDVLPCRFCRESYKKFITIGDTELTDAVMACRATLTKWFYLVHEAVNAKLEVDYGITYTDVVNKYESFRAKCKKSNRPVKGCVAPLDYKAFSFKNIYIIDAPIVQLEIIVPFVILAFKRGLPIEFFSFIELAAHLNGDFTELKTQKCWPDRNIICEQLIKHMRLNAIVSIEPETSEFAGTPTISELKLLMFLSSNLCHTELLKAQNATKKHI